jgi:membrane protein
MARIGCEIWTVTRQTLSRWNQDNCPRMAAALAFYTCFSLCPALLIGLKIAGMFVGSDAAKAELISKLESILSRGDISYVLSLLDSFTGHLSGHTLPIIGGLAALFTASAVFAELRSAMNTIWNVKPGKGIGILSFIYTRAIAFLLVAGTGILLVVWMVAGTVLSALNAFFSSSVPVPYSLFEAINKLVSLAVLPLLLACAYKLIPDTKVEWQDVWLGAAVATGLMLIGKYAVGTYLRVISLTSVYGAAGSLFVLLLWVYYSAQVVFLGAELTTVYARRYGSRSGQNSETDQPPTNTVPAPEEQRTRPN